MAPPRRRKLFQGILCQAERVSQDRRWKIDLYEISSARTLRQMCNRAHSISKEDSKKFDKFVADCGETAAAKKDF
jgi:hypothetical protein